MGKYKHMYTFTMCMAYAYKLSHACSMNAIVEHQRRLEPETQARDLGRPRAICAMLGMQSEVCNHTLYHR